MIDTIHHADIFDLCAVVPDASADMILCDLPYDITQNRWDNLIPFEPMWGAFKRVVKPGAAIVLTASQPFTSLLVCSNLKAFRYEWIWRKSQGSNFLNANKMPLKQHESVLVFCDKLPVYYPQMTKGDPYQSARNGRSDNYGYFKPIRTINLTGDRYPVSVIHFKNENQSEKVHPTQKTLHFSDT